MNGLSSSVPNPGDLLSRSQVAEMFNVAPSTVTRWADQGKLIYIRTLGGHRRYPKEGITEIVRQITQEEQMETMTIEIPKLYGDHHVQAVHQALAGLSGIQNIWASAAERQVRVVYDPEKVAPASILGRLAEAGLPSKNGDSLSVAGSSHKDPAWAQLGLRVTQTHPADRANARTA